MANRQVARGAHVDTVQASSTGTAADMKRLVHKGIVLHFMLQLSLVDDAAARLAAHSMGRAHHRIIYFAHFTPGITVSELLAVLGVKHQSIQGALRQLIEGGYVWTRASAHDGRVKQLYCSRKGDKLLEFVSAGQQERVQRGYRSVTKQDVEGYFKVMAAMLGADRCEWAQRLTEWDDPSEAV